MTRPPVGPEDWRVGPLLAPEPLPPPTRLWTPDEVERLRLGHRPSSMEDRWFAYHRDNRLHLHRSWTGHGIYEATFAPVPGGYRIAEAVVTGDRERYRRADDAEETGRLERLITELATPR